MFAPLSKRPATRRSASFASRPRSPSTSRSSRSRSRSAAARASPAASSPSSTRRRCSWPKPALRNRSACPTSASIRRPRRWPTSPARPMRRDASAAATCCTAMARGRREAFAARLAHRPPSSRARARPRRPGRDARPRRPGLRVPARAPRLQRRRVSAAPAFASIRRALWRRCRRPSRPRLPCRRRSRRPWPSRWWPRPRSPRLWPRPTRCWPRSPQRLPRRERAARPQAQSRTGSSPSKPPWLGCATTRRQPSRRSPHCRRGCVRPRTPATGTASSTS